MYKVKVVIKPVLTWIEEYWISYYPTYKPVQLKDKYPLVPVFW